MIRWLNSMPVAVAGIRDDSFFSFIDPDALWIEPRSGTLRRGPYVQSKAYPLRQLFDVPSNSHLDPLSIQTYSDTNTVIDYLVRIFPIDMIFKEVGTRVKSQLQRVTAFGPWPYLVSSLRKRNQQHVIARWTELTVIPQYVCVEARVNYVQRCGVLMEDGSVRFQFADPPCFRYLQLQYRLFHGSEQLDIESVWLAQAHSIFSQLGVHEDEWEDYSIVDSFHLTLYPYNYWRRKAGIASNKPTPYLFVRPIPRPSDDETTRRSRIESMYFWSLDPSGQEEMSESTKVSLGLPSFETTIEFWYKSWDFKTYKLIESFQRFKGFDPKATDYARSLGYPLLQVVGDEDRFQELKESNDDCSTSEDEESMSVDHDPPCPDNASHDIISPPRPNNTSANEMPDTETDEEVTVGNKRKSKSAGSSSKRRKVHTDHGEDEDATTKSTIKRLRTTAAYAKNPVQIPKQGRWDNLPQRELSSRKVRPSVRAQEAREARSEGSTSKKWDRGGRNGQGRANWSSPISRRVLFGYSDSQYGLPALIFYDALIPLSRVLLLNWSNKPNRANRWVELYFRLQAMVAGIRGDLHSGPIDPNKLWIEPRSGALRRGPYVQSNADRLNRLFGIPSIPHLDPLSIQTYSDVNTVIDYLARILPIDMIFEEVGTRVKSRCWGVTAFGPWPYIVGSLRKRNQQLIIARWMGLTQIPQYVCVKAHDARFGRCGVFMEDGSVRFQFARRTDFGSSLWLTYKLFHGTEQLDIESAWLAQAHSIFSQLGVHEDEWKKYSIVDGFRLNLSTYRKRNVGIASNESDPYLFVRPIPRPSDDETTWRSWTESTYFWSLDPSGEEEMLESTRVSLGLPSFRPEINLWYKHWNFETYKVIEKYQRFKGFDPKTTDYARSLGYPLIQVVRDEDRFQELGESNDDCSASEDEESMSGS
ncbi:hypothetical protein WG66_014494 [Moniliophthora roreri]|nr:hypothetical protein WG66_014494 [Moniliophthora roreri]